MNKAITWTETTFLCKMIDREKNKTKPQHCKDNDKLNCEMSSLRSCILVKYERFYMHIQEEPCYHEVYTTR